MTEPRVADSDSRPAAVGAPAAGGSEDEVGRLEALLYARSGEVGALLIELARLRALLRDALARLPGAADDAETMALRGELAGSRMRADEADEAFEAVGRRVARPVASVASAAPATPAVGAARSALEQARAALVEVAGAIHDVTRSGPSPGAELHDTIPGLSLPEIDSSR